MIKNLTNNQSDKKKRKAHRFGLRAELAARLLLRAKGYRILVSRHLTPYGEIDIVAERFGLLAFIEVKARPDATSGLYSITPAKQKHIAQAAEYFLGRHPGYGKRGMRFDLVLCRPFRLPRHIKDAWRL